MVACAAYYPFIASCDLARSEGQAFLWQRCSRDHTALTAYTVCGLQNSERLDSEIIYDRDFDYDYFGFKASMDNCRVADGSSH